MKKLSFGLLVAVVVSACGCGGGGGAEPPAPVASVQAATPPAEPEAFRIRAYGDSTQGGYTLASDGRYVNVSTPADEAHRRLREWSARDEIVVEQEGLGGTTSADLLHGTDGSGLAWAQRLPASVKIVTINHAINDNARPIADFSADLRELVLIAKQLGKAVVLETPNPIVAGGALSPRFDIAAHQTKVQAVREVAAETGAVLCDQHQAIVDAGLATLQHLPDGVHPSPALYLFKGRTLGACLLPLLR